MSSLAPKKSLGQHWLNDHSALQAVCNVADIKSDETILEIGPGLGTLTKLLTARAKEVIAVEFDERLAQDLPSKLEATNVRVVQKDILKFDLTTLPTGYKVVANIPYYLTSHLIRMLSESSNPPAMAVLLVQEEVAERAAARPGDMSLLSVTAQFYWEVSLGSIVEAELFTPPPKVDSQILILKRRPKPLFPDVDQKQFFRVVKAGFAARRKTLLNSMGGGLRISKSEAGELLERAGIDPSLRAQSLSLPHWHALYQAALSQGVL